MSRVYRKIQAFLGFHFKSSGRCRLTSRLIFELLSDPYVRLSAGDTALLSSSVLENTRNPRWDQDFRVNVCCAESELLLKVREL